jgi:hypothetical protein
MKSLREPYVPRAYARRWGFSIAQRFISLRANDIEPTRLNEALSHYVAYERLRVLRGHLLPRLAWLLLVCWMFTLELHLLPTAALVITGIAVAVVTLVVIYAERRARSNLYDFLIRFESIQREHA